MNTIQTSLRLSLDYLRIWARASQCPPPLPASRRPPLPLPPPSGAAVKDAKSPELAKTVWSIVRANGFVSQDRPGDFNQALMELGATICTPRNPSCSACPLGGAAISGNVICKAFRGDWDLTIDSERLLKSPAVSSKDNAKKNNKNNVKSAKGDGKAFTQTKLSFGSSIKIKKRAYRIHLCWKLKKHISLT